MLRRLATASGVGCASAAYVYSQWLDFNESVESSAVAEEHLPLSAESQRTRVVRVPQLLNAAEIQAVHDVAARLKPLIGSAGRTAHNQAAAYRNGAWETMYLSTDGLLAKEMPWLQERIRATAAKVDQQQGWKLLDRATTPVNTRCVEYHTVDAGGSLPYPTHYDHGSLLTLDILLTDPDEFDGGEFSTLEADGTMLKHEWRAGDALVFQSHKFHCVSPVTAGRRNVLITELWEGEERHCAHRCEKHRGHCGHTARMSFWRRALSDLASDL